MARIVDMFTKGSGAPGSTPAATAIAYYLRTSNNHIYVWDGSAWQDTGSAGGALTQIALTTLGSAATNVNFTSIPSTYNTLYLVWTARGDNATTSVQMRMQFNADTGANYDDVYVTSTGAGTVSGAGDAAQTFIRIGDATGASAVAGVWAAGRIEIPFYAGTTGQKSCVAQGSREDAQATANMFSFAYAGFWRNTAAISSIKLTASAGNWITGSSFALYGLT